MQEYLDASRFIYVFSLATKCILASRAGSPLITKVMQCFIQRARIIKFCTLRPKSNQSVVKKTTTTKIAIAAHE